MDKKCKVFYGQEPPCGESTTTDSGVNYQLLAVIIEVAQWGTPSCRRPQPATDNGARDGGSNWLVAPPTLMCSAPWAPRINRDSNSFYIAIMHTHMAIYRWKKIGFEINMNFISMYESVQCPLCNILYKYINELLRPKELE